jgi:drug/metabolite transporter (DMT)-like permease
MWLVLLLNMLFASSFTFGKAALAYVSPFLLISFRMLIAGAGMLVYQYFFNRKYWSFNRSHIWLFAQYTLFAIFISYVCEFWSLQYITSAKACMIFGLTPFLTALIAYTFLSERLTKRQWIGLIIGFLGFIPIVMTSDASESVAGSFGFLSVPEIVLFCAVLSASYGWIIMQQLVSDRSYSTVMVNGIGMLMGGVLTSIVSLIFEGWPTIKIPPQAVTWSVDPFWGSFGMFLLYAGLLIVIANLICFNLYGVLLRRFSATFISFTGFTQPLFASLFGWLLLSEKITWHFMASVVIVTAGLYLFHKDELKVDA